MRSLDKNFYVYVHLRNTDGSIFYIGKGRRRRAWSFCNRNADWNREKDLHGCFVYIAKNGMSEPCALTLERIGISMIGLENLANQRAGHRGANSGWSPNEEMRKKIGDANRGKKRRPESIAKTRAAHLGVKRSPEVCARLKIAAQNRKKRGPPSLETREKIAAAHRGMKASPEAIAAMRAASPRLKGKESPSYDHTVRSFVHLDGRIFKGTRMEFKEFLNGPDSCISHLINGKRFSVKGWRLL